jgi:hypothetical protein
MPLKTPLNSFPSTLFPGCCAVSVLPVIKSEHARSRRDLMKWFIDVVWFLEKGLNCAAMEGGFLNPEP